MTDRLVALIGFEGQLYFVSASTRFSVSHGGELPFRLLVFRRPISAQKMTIFQVEKTFYSTG